MFLTKDRYYLCLSRLFPGQTVLQELILSKDFLRRSKYVLSECAGEKSDFSAACSQQTNFSIECMQHLVNTASASESFCRYVMDVAGRHPN